jgi:hypothetical protein
LSYYDPFKKIHRIFAPITILFPFFTGFWGSSGGRRVFYLYKNLIKWREMLKYSIKNMIKTVDKIEKTPIKGGKMQNFVTKM